MRAGRLKPLPSSARRSPTHIYMTPRAMPAGARRMAVMEVMNAGRTVPVHLRRAAHARQPGAYPAEKGALQCAGLDASVAADGCRGARRALRPTSRFVVGGALRQNGRRRRSVNLSAHRYAAGPTMTRRHEWERQGNPARLSIRDRDLPGPCRSKTKRSRSERRAAITAKVP